MKILIIGGTGTISSAVCQRAYELGFDISLLNRGNRESNLKLNNIIADAHDYNSLKNAVDGLDFDVVIDFIAFKKEDVERDYAVFKGKIKQYIFISSASAYEKPLINPLITESTPLFNPFWQYSRDKIECENFLMECYNNTGFPITIVRPSHTYGLQSVPVALHGKNGSYSIIQRMMNGKPVIVHGDGTSLWTLTFNTDFALGFCGLIGNTATIGEAYHITSDQQLPWNYIMECIANNLNLEANIVHIASDTICQFAPEFIGPLLGDKAHSPIFDNSKIKGLVPEFKTKIPFEQGIKYVIDHVLSHEECQKQDTEFDMLCDNIIEFAKINPKA